MIVPTSAQSVLSTPSPIIGTVAGPSAAAAFAADISDDSRRFGRLVNNASVWIAGGSGHAASALRDKLTSTLSPGASLLSDSGRAAQEAFSAYAREVERIHRSARSVRQRTAANLTTIRASVSTITQICDEIQCAPPSRWDQSPPPILPEPALDPSRGERLDAAEQIAVRRALAARHEAAWRAASASWEEALAEIDDDEREWSTLRDDRLRAERQLLGELGDTELGKLLDVTVATGAPLVRTVAFGFSGEYRGRPAAPAPRTHHPLLTPLLGTASGAGIWEEPPDPERVAAWWDGLTSGDRRRLLEEVPWVVGNLPGLPFRVRDRANRTVLDHYRRFPGQLGASGRKALADLLTVLSRDGEPPATIVSLRVTRETPLVVVGYGDLDRARSLTWQVPGMGNDADQALGAWDRASRNLYREQRVLYDALRLPGEVAVVSFLGYDTPDTLDSLHRTRGVTSETYARAGSARLAHELDGAWAARNHALELSGSGAGETAPTIAVTSHSYGTTTAANALTRVRHQVDSFTMAGSAGIDSGVVRSLDDLRVAGRPDGRRRIFASHATADALAPVGISVSGRANPNPDMEFRRVPNLAGAIHYSSDGYTHPDGTHFTATDGHSVIGEAGGIQRITASEGRGYWDGGTQSLRNLAASALGRDDQIVGGLYARE